MAIDTSRVPRYRWERSERVEVTTGEVTEESIAAAVERNPRERHLRTIMGAFTERSNVSLTFDEIKSLGVPDTFLTPVRQKLRSTGLPFTLIALPGGLYKLAPVKPPKFEQRD